MTSALPRVQVPPAGAGLPPAVLSPFLLADGSVPARMTTTVRLAWDPGALHVRYECRDRDAWGTFTRRDDPLWEEEVVELFIAPGSAVPARYFELEVSPRGVLFDACVDNPTSRREQMAVDPRWDCPGLAWAAGPLGREEDWWASLDIPWAALTPRGELPRHWRANFHRVERPRGGEAELSSWSPTLTRPPDFHKPERFGHLLLSGPQPGAVRRKSSRAPGACSTGA